MSIQAGSMDQISPTPPDEEHTVIEVAYIPVRGNENAARPVILTPDGDELSPLLGAPPVRLPAVIATDPSTPGGTADPEFDAYMAVVKLLIGGTVEGTAELVRRLEKWETELNAGDEKPGPGEIRRPGDVARYMLVGMALSAGEGMRRQAVKMAQTSDIFWRRTGNVAQPLVNNRLTGIVGRPLDRAFERLVNRGQKRVNDWVELGRAQEPGARQLARKAYLQIVDEFISHLAENQELADLVQEQSMGLASEAVDEFRSRTVSADEIAESLVRRILRRPPRRELPPPPEAVTQAVVDMSKPPRRSQ